MSLIPPNPEQLDALKELVNIGIGRASRSLNEMTNTHVSLQVPNIEVIDSATWHKRLAALNPDAESILSVVQLGFKGVFSGTVALLFPAPSAANLVNILTAEQTITQDLNAIRTSTLTEIGNILINGIMGSIGNILTEPLLFSIPRYHEGDSLELMEPSSDHTHATILLLNTNFTIETKQIKGSIVLLFEVGSFDNLLSSIMDTSYGS